MNRIVVILLGIVGAAVVVRFATTSPLWLDEALSVNLASLPRADLPGALRHDGHPILYYALLGFWIDMFGDDDGPVRWLSALFSLATVPAVWAGARRRLGPIPARYAAVLTVTSPFVIRYGSEARMYALMMLITALGWWLLEASLGRPTWWRLTALAAVTAAGLHTHYWMIPLAAATMTVLAAGWFRSPNRRRTLAAIMAAVAVGGLTFVAWLEVFVDQFRHTGTPWANWARPAEVAVETIQAIGGGTRFEPVLLGVVLTLAIVLGATIRRTGHRWLEIASPALNPTAPVVGVVVISLSVGGLAAAVTQSAFEARYAAAVVPLLLGLAGRGLAGLTGRASLLTLVAVAAFGVIVAVDDAVRDRTQGQQVADTIDEGSAPGDLVVICPDQLAPATLRYLDSALTVRTYPPTADPGFIDWFDYRDRIAATDPVEYARAAARTAGSGTVWMVTMPTYRGLEGRCEAVSTELDRRRTRRTMVTSGPEFEPMFLYRFEAGP